MLNRIFINYRRGESLKDAQHLQTLLGKVFGDKRVFVDVHSIDGGTNWLQTIERQVAASDAMVALIGRGWASFKDEHGNRRLDDPEDFVRFEIAQALQRNIPVLPVLLDGATMPKVSDLPPPLLALSLFQAMPLRTESVLQDADAIAQRLRVLVTSQRRRGVAPWMLGVGMAASLLIGAVASPFVLDLMHVSLPGASAPAELQALRGQLATAERERDTARKDLAEAAAKLADLDKQLDTAQRERDAARKDLANAAAKAADLRRIDKRVLPISPADTTIIDPSASVRFRWIGLAGVDDYVLTLVARDPANNNIFVAHEIPITGRPDQDGAVPVSTGGAPAPLVKYADLNFFQSNLPLGEYFWSVNEVNAKPEGNQYRRFSLYRTSVQKIENKKSVDVGSSWIPDGIFMRRDESSKGAYYGFEPDLLAQIAAAIPTSAGKPAVSIRHVEWDNLLSELAANRIDIVASTMTKTKKREREARILFSEGYFTTHQRFIVREGKTGCLRDMVIGVVAGDPITTNQQAAALLAAPFAYSAARVKLVKNSTELLRNLRNGTFDAGLVDDVSVRRMVMNGQDETGLEFLGDPLDAQLAPLGFYRDFIGYPSEEFAFAVQSTQTELLKRINDVLAAMKKDGSLAKMQAPIQELLLNRKAKQKLC